MVYLDDVFYLDITHDIIESAIKLAPPIGGADSIHIATAIKIGTGLVTVVTHDRQMADAAQTLGFKVIDPVTDDPNRLPVA